MKNIKKLLAMMLMLASVFFIACEDDDEIVKMSPEEAQTTLNQMSTSMSAELDRVDTEGFDAMAILVNMNDPFATKSANKTTLLYTINEMVQPGERDNSKMLSEPEPFNFAALAGTYEWNHALQRWSVELTPTDAIVIIFPADSTDLNNNNAKVVISNYSEELISVPGETAYYAPTSISYELFIDDVKYLGIELSATWNSITGEPTEYSEALYVKPLTFRQEFVNTAALSSMGYYIDFEDDNIFSISLDAIYDLASLGEEPSEVTGKITYGDLKIKVSADLDNIEEVVAKVESGEITDVEEIQDALNAELDATVYYDGEFVADIELRYNPLAYVGVSPDDYDDVFPFYAVFVFSDGSEMAALPFFIELAESLEDFFEDIEDYVDEFFDM